MEARIAEVLKPSHPDMTIHPSKETQKRERIRMYARLTAWTILIISVLLIGTALAYLRNTTIGLATAFAGSLIIYECVLVLKKANAIARS